MVSSVNSGDRRSRCRFGMERELRYKVLRRDEVIETGTGRSLNVSSTGVAFTTDQELAPGCFVELSISWPAMLNDRLPMRLVVFGRVVRCLTGRCAATIDKYEFRTDSSAVRATTLPRREDQMLRRWAEGVRKQCSQSAYVAALVRC